MLEIIEKEFKFNCENLIYEKKRRKIASHKTLVNKLKASPKQKAKKR